MRKWLLLLSLSGLAEADPGCYLKAPSFFKLETGVQGGIAFSRSSEVLVIPDSSGSATVWVEEGSKYRKGSLSDYPALEAELDSLGIYTLKNYEPSMSALDPYGAGSSALHAHDGNRCFSYSPQRDCSVMGKGELPPEAERKRFRAIVERLQAVGKRANSSVSREQFQAAEQSLWKS
ncbi:hypothetical protein JST97_34260 [bacterium]|nr:hypothetical protein [bacterium]